MWKILFTALTVLSITQAPSHAQDLQKFAVGLYKNIASTSQPGQNIAISPFSADAALSMTFVGAAGATKSELGSSLGVNDNTAGSLAQKFKSVNAASASYTLQSANGIFLEKTYDILPAYRGKVVNDFGANISSVDFANQAETARKQINAFVEAKTNNKIKDLFPADSLDSSTKLVLVNAVYFKANWEEKFEKSATSSQPFTLAGGDQKNANLMNQVEDFRYAESAELGGAQVLELRYTKGETSMVVILPKKETGIQALESSLTAAALDSALGQLSSNKVDVYLPKFKVNTDYQLVEPLKALGIKAAFSNQADFSGISQKGNLKISKVVQKVFVEVDETGTEAAAATGIQAVAFSAMVDMREPKTFRADRPFLYLIRHNQSKSILFMGRVANPTAEK